MAYVSLLQTPGFLEYFQQASPVEELARLKIGSRPARRFGAASLDDLRAIPWVFAWSQNRHLITGWYGFGAAMVNFRKFRGARGDEVLRDMFRQSRLFRLAVDEMEKSLYQTDMTIAAKYSELVCDANTRHRILQAITSEYCKACDAVKFLNGGQIIGQRFPRLCERVERKRDELARIHTLQVDLLRQTRSEQQAGTVPVASAAINERHFRRPWLDRLTISGDHKLNAPHRTHGFFTQSLSDRDPELLGSITSELGRQRDEIELIASENIVSAAVMEAQGSVMTNKYAEGYPGRRYYGGCQYVDIAENLAIDRAKELFGCGFANVQPNSGSQANQGVFQALIKPGDTILGMSPGCRRPPDPRRPPEPVGQVVQRRAVRRPQRRQHAGL